MSKTNLKEIEINGVSYVAKDGADTTAPIDMPDGFSIVRTYSAGVFAGVIRASNGLNKWGGGKEGSVLAAIRIYYWSGAATLSQLAMEGVKNPDKCKFAMPVGEVILTEIIEVIPCTTVAYANIIGVKSWKK